MKKILYLLLCLPLMLTTGCLDKLDEVNHSKITPESFETSQGFTLGLNGVYGGMRKFFGPQDAIHILTVTGTDEFFSRSSGDIYNIGNYTDNFTPNAGYVYNYWRDSYTFINTCNGLVHFGENITDINEGNKKRMLAEARFFRAFLYFRLVQFFGDVTLNKTYNTSISTSATRAPIAEIYDFIIEDLKYCIEPGTMPAGPKSSEAQTGRVTAATAKHLLAKVYLTRGWSTAAQSTDFENAYKTAKGLIDESASIGLGLLDNYADVHAPNNENNKEALFVVQFGDDPIYGVASSDNGSNRLAHVFVSGYFNFNGSGNVQTIEDGRVYARYHGTSWLYNEAFGNVDADTRYSGTFQTHWYAPVDGNRTQEFYVGDSEKLTKTITVKAGDLAGWLPGKNLTEAEIRAHDYYIVTPENYTDPSYPTMKKYLDPNRESKDFDSRRSIIVYRLAETYLIAAEAAFKMGNTGTSDGAAYYINELRKRAAADGKENDMLISSGDVTLDFILDERTREPCGEQLRWFDLVRTQTLVDRVKRYGFFQTRWHTQSLMKDNIDDFHVLRPIPQKQIDDVITGDPYPQQPNGWDQK